jgi:DNA-directed RNA polymerase subunit RPC12/RpoP
MAMVAGKCPKCQQEIQVENRNMTYFCTHCGEKSMVSHAISLYEYAHPEVKNIPDEEKIPDPDSAESIWQTILAKTNDLKPAAIRRLEDYAYEAAAAIFSSDIPGIESEWRDSYQDALEASCRMAVEAVNPRVFLERKIYQWYASSNTFLYPISRDFDIQPVLDKELWSDWNPMIEAFPEFKRDEFRSLCEGVCRRIRECFQSGFSNMTELQNGDLSRLMGTWRLKLTTGAAKTQVLNFSQNEVEVPHLEAHRTDISSYDYYRYIQIDGGNRITADEHRHFPSDTGLGGDFYELNTDALGMGLMAVYEYILVMPTALYVRVEPEKIPGYGKALVYAEKCRVMPCFHRGENLKHSYQMRAIAENHETAEPSKRMRLCYIATAVYGDIDAPQVRRLRRYRDEKLNSSRLGRRLCLLYYKLGPRLALRMSPAGPVSRMVRRMLDWFVRRLED